MSSTSPTASTLRLFTSPKVYSGMRVALGRNHSSWHLVAARCNGQSLRRTLMCLNFIVPDDESTINATSPEGAPRFTVAGMVGKEIMEKLLALRDSQGHPPVKVVKRYPPGDKYRRLAIVEVTIPSNECMYACARCGLWETPSAPRFLRCGGCKSRFYCSQVVSPILYPACVPRLNL